jgi:putative ABC transport system substrate-binding protein
VLSLSRRQFLQGGLALVGLGLLAGCGVRPGATPSAGIARIGLLSPASQSVGGVVDNCKLGLSDLGYVEGQHYTLDARYAEGNAERLPDLAADLARSTPDVVIAAGTLAIVAIKAASDTIPIVMSNLGDPVGARLIASLGRPGGNVTGVSGMAVQLSGKRLELLRGLIPAATRVAAIWSAPDTSMAAEYGETRVAGQTLGITVEPMGVSTADDLDRAFAIAAATRLDGVVMIADPLMYGNRRRLVELALQHRLPTVSSDAAYAAAGGLMSYGPNGPDQQRRTAYYVDKILKGAKPADLPVEQPTAFELVINLQAAQALGLTVPQSVLQQTTRVIQ